MAGCTSPQPGSTGPHDPFESLNRKAFAFNRGTDRYFFGPVSRGYVLVVPSPIRTSLKNFSSNLGMPGVVVNDLLQADVDDAAHNSFRFVFNTVFGFGGLLDPATDAGLDRRDTDFDRTLATWGVEPGAYLVLPFLGPSSERATAGRAVDIALNPVNLLGRHKLSDAFDFALNPVHLFGSEELRDAAPYAGIPAGLGQYAEFGPFIALAYYSPGDGYAEMRDVYIVRREFAESERESDEEYDAVSAAPASAAEVPFDKAVELHDAGREGDVASTERAVAAFDALVKKDAADPVVLAYLGSSYALLARDSRRVANRMRYANRGLSHLDDAVSMAPDKFTPRFIRVNVTAHIPAIFGRTEQAVEDLLLLDAMFTEARSPSMAGGMIGIYELLSEKAPEKGDWTEKARIARELAER